MQSVPLKLTCWPAVAIDGRKSWFFLSSALAPGQQPFEDAPVHAEILGDDVSAAGLFGTCMVTILTPQWFREFRARLVMRRRNPRYRGLLPRMESFLAEAEDHASQFPAFVAADAAEIVLPA